MAVKIVGTQGAGTDLCVWYQRADARDALKYCRVRLLVNRQCAVPTGEPAGSLLWHGSDVYRVRGKLPLQRLAVVGEIAVHLQ